MSSGEHNNANIYIAKFSWEKNSDGHNADHS